MAHEQDEDFGFDELVEEQERETDHRGRRRRRGGGLRSLIPALLVLVVVAGLAFGGLYAYRWVTSNVSVEAEETDFRGPGTGEATIVVEEGDTGTDIAASLVDAGVIKTQGPFITQFTNTPEAASIEPGVYRLQKEMPAADALTMLLDPESLAGQRVIIPEALRTDQIWERLSEATDIPVEDFEKAAEDYTSYGVPENDAGTLEGYLWPGRYDISEDATAEDIIGQMTGRMEQELEKRDVPKKDWHRLLTVASLTEMEVREEEDYGKVARTIENRLAGAGEADGSPMPLQFDSTIHFITGKDGRVATSDKDRDIDDPYNTYKFPGLPPGPIGSPGAAGIDAALDPPEGDWLYFVTVNTDTGETKFASTYEQHQKYVREWREWARKQQDG